MTSAEPAAQVVGEATLFAAYFSFLRESVAEAVLGLSVDEQRTTRLVSGWTPLELLSHLAHMERRWFVWGWLQEDVDDPWGDRDPDRAHWHVPDEVTAESLVELLRAVGRRTDEVLAAHDLDTWATPAEHFDEGLPTLRWICFHVLHEYARHAGHLDIAVELALPAR